MLGTAERNGSACGVDLERVLEQRIRQRTGSKIHRLRVELIGGRAIVHGCTSTHYSKQLALAGAQEVVSGMPVELNIRVGKSVIARA